MASDWPHTFLQPGCFCLAYLIQLHSEMSDSASVSDLRPPLIHDSITLDHTGRDLVTTYSLGMPLILLPLHRISLLGFLCKAYTLSSVNGPASLSKSSVSRFVLL